MCFICRRTIEDGAWYIAPVMPRLALMTLTPPDEPIQHIRICANCRSRTEGVHADVNRDGEKTIVITFKGEDT